MIIGQPKKLSPAFNNLYLYASSTNTTEPGFRYYTTIAKTDAQQSSLDVVAFKNIKPRFGDNNLEYNFNKTAQSLLGDLTDDIDFNNTTLSTVFYNTPSSGIDLLIGVDDTYQVTWPFNGTYSTFFGQVGLSGNTEPLYQAGDQIIVQGLSSFFEYTAIVNGTLNYAEFTLTEPHNLSVGDVVLIQQDSPFTYPIYNNYFEVLFAGNPYAIGVDLAFQGTSQLPQTGRLVYNTSLDGVAVVLNAGGSFPNYFVEINRSSTGSTFGPITLSPTLSGDTRYADNRLSDFPNGVMGVTTIFNGGMDRKLWLDYTSGDYSTLIDQWKFLTSLPNQWSTKLDNDIYLNFWNYGLDYDYLNLVITTKNCSGGTIDSYILPYDGSLTATTVQSINVGPSHINEICPTVEKLLNSGFWDTSAWILTTTGTASGSIVAGTLRYNATFPGSVGRVRATQNNVLTIGEEYTLCFDVTQNVNCDVQFNNGIGVLATSGQTGEQCFTFIATSANFIVSIDGLSSFPVPSCRIDYVSVTQPVCDLLNCDICSYDIQLDSRAMDTRVQNIPLDFGNAYDIFNFNNAYTVIDNGELQYNDLVEFGGIGGSIVTQDCVFVSGYSYTVSINISNNSNVLVQAGQSGGPFYPIGTSGATGTFDITFTATNPTLVILLSGLSEFGTNGATISSIQVYLNDVFVTSSQTMSFTLDCSCEGRYTNYPIIFKDRMGSFVTFNFDLNNKQMVDINRTKYNSFVGGGPVTDLNASCLPGRFSYSLNDTGNKVFSTLIQEKWELNADAMTEEESVYFEELLTSPRAAIKIDGQYYAINIEDNTYTRVRKNNQKMIYHKLNISFANNNPIQSL
jgi:hypothetical protein